MCLHFKSLAPRQNPGCDVWHHALPCASSVRMPWLTVAAIDFIIAARPLDVHLAMQNQEHTCFFRFQSELHETLTPLQFAMALALKQLNGVSMWLMIQLLSTQTSSAPCGSDEQPTASPGVRKTAPPTSCHQGVAQPASASGADGNGGRETSQNSSGDWRCSQGSQ